MPVRSCPRRQPLVEALPIGLNNFEHDRVRTLPLQGRAPAAITQGDLRVLAGEHGSVLQFAYNRI
jgi:hypothetical protein